MQSTERGVATFSFENNTTGLNRFTPLIVQDFYFSQQIGLYRVLHKLGQGRYGLVKLGVSQTGQKVAIKIISKSALSEEERRCVRTEAEVMHFVKHTNVVALYHVVENRTNVCLCMEFAGGGELFEYIVKQQRLQESEARKLWIQCLDGIGYCHDRKIVHRDIKAGQYISLPLRSDFY
jgi:serine/threonine protein kinase